MNKYVLPCGYSEPFLYYNIHEDDHASQNEILKEHYTHGPGLPECSISIVFYGYGLIANFVGRSVDSFDLNAAISRKHDSIGRSGLERTKNG